jgi:hypothetical protein
VKQCHYFCYTDINPRYDVEGFSTGQRAYIDHGVEYPILTGGAMQVAAWLVSVLDETIRARSFYDVTVVMLATCAVLGVLASARAAGTEQRKQALMVALSPALILCAFINWDLIAFAPSGCAGSRFSTGPGSSRAAAPACVRPGHGSNPPSRSTPSAPADAHRRGATGARRPR